MVDATHSHQPSHAVIDALVQMFACQGITLNLFVDDAVPHVDVIRCVNLGDDFWTCLGPASFRAYKATYADTNGLLGWHYCLLGHDYDSGSGTGSSGLAELAGNDLVVTLGSFNGGAGGTDFEIAATIAHELGHNLGLDHRSPNSSFVTDSEDYAPNYASIMSYHYQLRGVATQMRCLGLVSNDHRLKDLDYSHGRMPDLFEFALDERVGVGINPVDFDCDGVVDSSTVNRDIDSDDSWCDTGNGMGILRDHDDWANIVDYTFLAAVSADTTKHVSESCMTVAEHVAAQLKGLQDPSSCPGSTPTLSAEACISSQAMAWVDPSAVGALPDGSGSNPFRDLADALAITPEGSVLYLQAGTHANGGVPIVIDTPRVLEGPGGAVVDP